MAAKRKFTLTAREVHEEVVADRVEVKDGAACFFIDGFLVDAHATGTWDRVTLVPNTEENPTRRRT